MPLKRLFALSLTLIVAACGGNAGAPADHRIPVVTTISTLNSFVEAVGGSRVDVRNIVPVGASAETYQPTPQDVALIAQAKLLVENGSGLEAWMQKLSNAGSSHLRILVCTDGLPVKNGNPHLWMDPQYAKRYVDKIRDQLIELDPEHARDYRRNAAQYDHRLDRLTASIARRFAQIPADRRVMIVFHNAWQYYNDRFGITTLGFVEPSPGQEPNPQRIARLIDLAKQHHVRAVFAEPEYSPKLLQQIAHNAGVGVVENLYDDSVGTDPRVADYIGMIDYDTSVIVKSMR